VETEAANIAENAALEVQEHEVKNIPLSQIEQNENSRVVYKQAELGELMQSLKANGMLQAIGVKKLGANRYEAVWGNRRILAAKKLGWHDIPARIIEAETDIDRDILGLIENLKRQNTSLTEDGRMFASLRDRGLSVKEIAARLSISEDRVNLALDVVEAIPREYQKLIKRNSGAAGSRDGTISPHAAKMILDVRRRHKLTQKQVRQLLDFARDKEISPAQLEHVAPLLRSGETLSKAMGKASALTRITLLVYVDKRRVETLEKRHQTTITDLLWQQIQKNTELGAIRTLEPETASGKKKLVTVARLGA
jgi:ParB family chromosome partitioning protein